MRLTVARFSQLRIAVLTTAASSLEAVAAGCLLFFATASVSLYLLSSYIICVGNDPVRYDASRACRRGALGYWGV